jgi:hypothetical protein
MLSAHGGSASCQSTCAGEQLCDRPQDCPMDKHCDRNLAGIGVCMGMRDAGGRD